MSLDFYLLIIRLPLIGTWLLLHWCSTVLIIRVLFDYLLMGTSHSIYIPMSHDCHFTAIKSHFFLPLDCSSNCYSIAIRFPMYSVFYRLPFECHLIAPQLQFPIGCYSWQLSFYVLNCHTLIVRLSFDYHPIDFHSSVSRMSWNFHWMAIGFPP